MRAITVLVSAAVAAVMMARVASAQSADAQTPTSPNAPVRVVEAVRLRDGAVRVDGRLDEGVWTQASPATGFVQREPREGEAALEETEVRFAYDDDALYVGARMHSRDPNAIRALIARRDRATPSEQLVVSLDTYRDRRTAYTFAVNVAGVRTDYYHAGDFEERYDITFDPVWEAATQVDSLGWTAELRIPFGQLRFNAADVADWGVNLVRRVPARNEVAYWSLIRRNETGWSSRMGVLGGLRELAPPRRIEVLPYVSADARVADAVDAKNPFVHERESGARIGGDVKLGIGSSLTLVATINPDFGQVEADPAEVNLSAFETFFPERRPFFLEGAGLFGGRGVFYSRRIGAPPPIVPSTTYHERRDATTILGAAKLTGRLPSKLSVGALTALTAREEVATFDTISGVSGVAEIAPLTGYGVAMLQHEFGRDASTVAAAFTAVERDLEPGSPLAAAVARRAYTGLVDSRIRWAGGKYDVSAFAGFSYVEGDSQAIRSVQLSSRRYYQRPDADHVRLDPARRSLGGTMFGINHSKMSGQHWLWDIDYWQESPGLELNDVGAIGAVDDRAIAANLRYRDTKPRRLLRSFAIGYLHTTEWNYGGTATLRQHGIIGTATLPNFWSVVVEAFHLPAVLSDNLTRGGPLMQRASFEQINAALANSASARTRWRVQGNMSRDAVDGWQWNIGGGISLRPGTRAELAIDPGWFRGVTSRQFLASIGGGSPATFGRRYVFAYVDRSEIVTRIRLNYALKPDLTLESYIEPFASSGRFHGFGELTAARRGDLRTYGTSGTTITRDASGYGVTDGAASFRLPDRDFNVRSLRSNLVLRWEWRPGSTAFLVWQQNRADEADEQRRAAPWHLADALSANGTNYFALKVSYWLPVR